jgi:hypothetical protein
MLKPYKKCANWTFLRLVSVKRHLPITTNVSVGSKTETLPQHATPEERDSYLTSLLANKSYKKLWKTVDSLKQSRAPITNNTYLILLRACAESNTYDSTRTAINLYYEAINQYRMNDKEMVKPLLESEHNELCRMLLLCLSKSHDFTDIVTLNLFWTNYIKQIANQDIELLYHSTYINILFNTHQNEIAFDYLEDILEQYFKTSSIPTLHIFKKLPMIRFLGILGTVKDCDRLNNWLRVIVEAESIENVLSLSIISSKVWIQSLNIALAKNHYDLVKTIYDNCIMKEFDNSSISTEQAVLGKVEENSHFFLSLTDEMVLQILHTFSTHGDVNLTLALIETHFLHKNVQGERALSKDLCIKIIDAYCYNLDLTLDWDAESLAENKHLRDESIMGLLDVLNGFVTKFKADDISFSYKDISTSISTKFWNYHVYDENIEQSITRQASIKEKIKEIVTSDETIDEILPKKVTNTNIASSRFGNQLANLDILEEFVKIHLDYLTTHKKFHNETITLFLNCLLNHLALFQNFSAIVRALLACRKYNSRLKLWLNDDLFNIILYSMANSSASKKCSMVLYKYLKDNDVTLTRDHFELFISANLRGYIHDGLQFFVYEYLKAFQSFDDSLWSLISTIPNAVIKEDEGTQFMVDFCKCGPHENEAVDGFWTTNKLCKCIDKIELINPTTYTRSYMESYDTRDSNYLKHILSI